MIKAGRKSQCLHFFKAILKTALSPAALWNWLPVLYTSGSKHARIISVETKIKSGKQLAHFMVCTKETRIQSWDKIVEWIGTFCFKPLWKDLNWLFFKHSGRSKVEQFLSNFIVTVHRFIITQTISLKFFLSINTLWTMIRPPPIWNW